MACGKDWFEEEFGFVERPTSSTSFDHVREQFECEQLDSRSFRLLSLANNAVFELSFETPSVGELMARLAAAPAAADSGGLTFKNIVADVRSLHMDPANAGAVIQAASQFNCLEMVGPGIEPEAGVTIYASDHTQGPACAMSCPAATVFRNYFADCSFHEAGADADKEEAEGGTSRLPLRGQGRGRQIDTTADVARVLGNANGRFWQMRNGYLLPSSSMSMRDLGQRLDEKVAYAARAALRVGVHWSTPTKTSRRRDRRDRRHTVCQVFCSAVPVSYAMGTKSADWAPLACVVLDGCYQATLAVAALLARERGRRQVVYLTCVGGGAFGNRSQWIKDAIQRAVTLFAREPLDVRLVHYGSMPGGNRWKVNVAPPDLGLRNDGGSGGAAEAISADLEEMLGGHSHGRVRVEP